LDIFRVVGIPDSFVKILRCVWRLVVYFPEVVLRVRLAVLCHYVCVSGSWRQFREDSSFSGATTASCIRLTSLLASKGKMRSLARMDDIAGA